MKYKLPLIEWITTKGTGPRVGQLVAFGKNLANFIYDTGIRNEKHLRLPNGDEVHVSILYDTAYIHVVTGGGLHAFLIHPATRTYPNGWRVPSGETDRIYDINRYDPPMTSSVHNSLPLPYNEKRNAILTYSNGSAEKLDRDQDLHSGNQFAFLEENVISWWHSPHGDAPLAVVKNGFSSSSGKQTPFLYEFDTILFYIDGTYLRYFHPTIFVNGVPKMFISDSIAGIYPISLTKMIVAITNFHRIKIIAVDLETATEYATTYSGGTYVISKSVNYKYPSRWPVRFNKSGTEFSTITYELEEGDTTNYFVRINTFTMSIIEDESAFGYAVNITGPATKDFGINITTTSSTVGGHSPGGVAVIDAPDPGIQEVGSETVHATWDITSRFNNGTKIPLALSYDNDELLVAYQEFSSSVFTEDRSFSAAESDSSLTAEYNETFTTRRHMLFYINDNVICDVDYSAVTTEARTWHFVSSLSYANGDRGYVDVEKTSHNFNTQLNVIYINIALKLVFVKIQPVVSDGYVHTTLDGSTGEALYHSEATSHEDVIIYRALNNTTEHFYENTVVSPDTVVTDRDADAVDLYTAYTFSYGDSSYNIQTSADQVENVFNWLAQSSVTGLSIGCAVSVDEKNNRYYIMSLRFEDFDMEIDETLNDSNLAGFDALIESIGVGDKWLFPIGLM